MTEIESKMIVDKTGNNAICLDMENAFFNWVMYKHPNGNWISKRPALPMEIINAKKRLDMLEALAGIPCRGG